MTDNTPARIEPAYAATMPAPQGGALPTGLEWSALERMAQTLADSDVIPYRLKRKPADVAVILLAAREYGIPPLMALSKLPVVNGTPAPMGELMVALVLRAGHRIRVTVEGEGGPWEDTVAVCTTRRRDEDTDDVLRFTFREAVDAGLVALANGKPRARDQKDQPTPWELYTVNMLRWRAVANACRLRFPDVLLGMSYLPEELGATVDAEGAPVDTVVEYVAPRGAPTGNLEQRTAQESADKLAEQPWPDYVVDAVRKAAEEGGYLAATVTYAGEELTLDEALVRHVEDRAHVDTVDAEIVEEEAETARQEPAEAPQAAEEASAGTPTPPTDQSPGSDETAETPQEAAYDLAREALGCRDRDVLLGIYQTSADLLALDVLPVLGDDDLAAIGAPSDLEAMALGAFLIAAGKYVNKHAAAIRDLDEPLPDQADPWAEDAAAGWPNSRTPAP